MDRIKHFAVKYLRNKYAITVIVFAVWLLFFDANDVFTVWENKQRLNELRVEKTRIQQEKEEIRQTYIDLATNMAARERYAREQFKMKRENEDVYEFEER